MRVNELSKQIGKSNKEVLEILQKNHFDVKSHSSKVTEEQAEAVRCFLAGAKRQTTASKTDTGKAETNRVEDIKKEPLEAEKKEAEKTTEPPKKRIAAVYRPQNSVQRGSRPAGKANTGNAAKTGAPASRPAAASAEQTAEPAKSAAPAENRDGQRSGYQGNRDGQRSGGYQGNRDGQRSGGYQGNRDGQRSGGYQGNRDGQRSGYQGNRDGQRNGGYQGNRDGQRSGGYQGSRDGQRSGGYQGSRDGQRSGGYQGNRDGQRSGGYQGNRDGQRSGGYQGNRDGQRSGGYQGGRDGQRGGRDGRGGLNIPKPSFDSPVVQKPQNNKQNKNNYKNDKYSKIDHEEEMHSKGRGGKNVKSAVQPPQKKEAKVEEIKTITIPEVITIKDLADKMKLQPSVIVKKLFLQGKVVTINQEVDYEQAEEIAMEFDVLCEKEVKVDVIEELLKEEEEDEKDMVTRPPVVCVMGHVDHGKTSLLDAIRQTNVTAKEAGGITQHIGAYMVEINGQKITFLDTPGHEAFTAMRMRGAKSTDIAILVVAADDGVMPQTIEAINHAKAAGVEIIVAINKIDKPSANIEKVKQELIEYELVPEDWGGSTIFVPVSAHTKEGIKELLEMILLTAEVKELKANPNRNARGLVIEAELDKGKGPVATVLVQKGTLHVGDPIAAGACYGRVRAMMDDKGRRVKEAGPSTPVEILGLNDVPNAGEVFVQPENEKEARSFAETFISESKNKLIEDTKMKLSLDDLFSQIKAGNVKELPLIVKADVQGSVEAVKQSLMKLSNEEVVVKVIHGGVGAINESDVSLAAASNAIIIGFNVRPDATAKSIAEREKVDVRLYRVIYQAIEDVEAAMKGMLDPIYEEQVIGHAVVRQTFKASGVGTIAGSYVLDGKFQRGCKARITRDGEQIFDGPLASLKRFKDDVKEVASGYECGLVFEKFNDLQEDDMIEAYAMVEVPR
ncbi:translation initiation factor IF-2 [Clostridium sp. AF27-5AA]|uniref:translation initiation factor IF-2 n=1 Tax=Clostridium sp. AF27-5AA TaxID=2293008 RepID=UPI000E5350F4|nr:translation initiation factor IF-2 [Clostridium sp. AF27-5AA]RHQ33498.1 translation initiation factor IF-2 [Clostridium sp. AF27-5AA]